MIKKCIKLEFEALTSMSYDLRYEFLELLKQIGLFSWELIAYVFEIIFLPFCAVYRLKLEKDRK